METTLNKPTIGEMIKHLSKFPADDLFLIRDTDTDWRIEIIEVFHDEEAKELWLSGSYETIVPVWKSSGCDYS